LQSDSIPKASTIGKVIFTYAVPRDDAFSRFVALLMDHQSLILRMFEDV
jgi:hypothetical protein